MVEKLLREKTSEDLLKWRQHCRDTQINKSKPEDYKLAWTIFWGLPAGKRYEWIQELYDQGVNDDHISTALMHVINSCYTRIICELKAKEETERNLIERAAGEVC